MPAKTELTWEQSTHRWKKVYKGRSYTVSCKALGVPPTKLESYQAANEWWAIKRTEIDGNAPPHPNAQHLDLLSQRLAWAQAHGRQELARSLEDKIETVRSDDTGELNGNINPFDVPSVVVDLIEGATWKERLDGENISLTPPDRTVGAQVDRYLALERVRAQSDQLSISEFDTIRRCLHAFRDHIGKSNNVAILDADRWEGWWSYLMTQAISVEYKKKRLRIARTFVSWLAEKGLIPVPLNLHSRRHRFGGGSRSVPTIPLDEVRLLIGQAPGQLKLHLLLMLNCGMTQVDIADLQPREVNWIEGRIKRKRSKTDDHDHVPTVDYALWPRTRQLLEQFGHRAADRVLLTASNRPWLRDELLPDGKRSKVDAIKSNYVHLQRKTGISHPMKLLRKTSATMIESHELFGRYTGHFLGHAPSSLAERHYAAPSKELFDKIVHWLGDQFGPTVTGKGT
jgi:integrase